MSLLVVDASVAAAWALPDQATASADALFRRWNAHAPIAPALYPLETRSILLKAERRGWLSRKRAGEALIELARLKVAIEPPLNESDLDRVTSVARASGLSFYDAIYLDLAIRTGAELATRDLGLGRAGRHAGVGVLDLN